MHAEPRDGAVRKVDALTILTTPAIDVLVATASNEIPGRTLMRDGTWLV
jgi:hypothetical protein